MEETQSERRMLGRRMQSFLSQVGGGRWLPGIEETHSGAGVQEVFPRRHFVFPESSVQQSSASLVLHFIPLSTQRYSAGIWDGIAASGRRISSLE